MSYDELVAYYEAQGKANPFLYAPERMAQGLGYAGPSRVELGLGGSPSEATGMGTEMQYGVDPAFEAFLKTHQFRPGMQGDNPQVDILDAAGNVKAQGFRTGDHTGSMMKFMGTAIPALAAAGFGAGALGAFGGSGATAGLDAWGSTLADSLSGLGLENVGALGAEAGTVGSGITGTLGGAQAAAAGAVGTAAPAAAGAGLWGSLISAGAPLIGSFITAGAQRTAGNTAADASVAASNAGIAQQNQQFAAIQKLLQPYVTAGTGALTGQQNLIGLNGAAPQQSAIDAIKTSPAFTSMQTLGENRILANASATGGLRGGNVQGALAQFSPQLLSQLIDQQYSRLGGLAQGGQNAAVGVGTAGLNTGNQITQLLGQVGQAQGGAALSQGQATGTLANGFAGAAGQFVGSGGLKSLQPLLNNLGGLF